MKKTLLTVDVGNSATTFGLFNADAPNIPRPVWNIPTQELADKKNTINILQKKIKGRNIKAIITSSVVPPADPLLRSIFSSMTSAPCLFVSAAFPSKIKIRYRKPKEVGADRIVNARAAFGLHKGPSIVVDFGTATTFDCITKKGEYIGGVIAPGPVIAAEALYQRTAKLPRVLLTKPAFILGHDTKTSIEAGLYHGYRGLVQEIVKQLKKKLGAHTYVFATGGQSKWILKDLSCIDRHVSYLTLLGLSYLWLDFNANRSYT